MPHRLLFALGPVVAVLALSAMPGLAQDEDTAAPRTISLTGTGEVTAQPDIAVITMGVLRVARTARQALSANNQAMATVLDALKARGIAAKDLQTSNFSIRPRYQRNKDGKPAQITGYQVSNQLTATIRDLELLGRALDQAVSLGSNQISGIRFAIDKPAPLKDQARRLATADAIGKAELYAKAAGVMLGPIMSITEASGFRPPQPVYARAARLSAESASAVPTAPGAQSVKISVNITWQIR